MNNILWCSHFRFLSNPVAAAAAAVATDSLSEGLSPSGRISSGRPEKPNTNWVRSIKFGARFLLWYSVPSARAFELLMSLMTSNYANVVLTKTVRVVCTLQNLNFRAHELVNDAEYAAAVCSFVEEVVHLRVYTDIRASEHWKESSGK